MLATWIDFQNYDWGVFSRASSNGGATFGSQLRVTDNVEGSNQQEELADSPDPLLVPHSPLVTWTDWRKRASAGHVPHEQYDIYAAVRMCERIVWIDRGRIVMDGEGALVIKAYEDSARFFFDSAKAVADSALRHGDVTPEDLRAAAAGLTGRNAARVRWVTAYADGRAENPFESVLRCLAIEEGLDVVLADGTVLPATEGVDW